ncbi:hypothetical protein GQ600_4346 [Phytophthora cactorum]|nr:hypothetical protein GQ600_4346 [Phytophthora cactorum]
MTWQSGIDTLTKTTWATTILHFISGEQGNFVKFVGTHKKDGAIATMVIQLPSSHEGGDLVIYRSDEVKNRHDIGKTDATAAFLPHYAIHYPDAEHSGTSDEGIPPRCLGIGALKGIDSVRFHALEEANSLVPAAQKPYFYIAGLAHQFEGFRGWRCGHYKDGKSLGRIKKVTMPLNFLNPAQKTLDQLWAPLPDFKEKQSMCFTNNAEYGRMRSLRGPQLSMKKTR